MAGADSDLARKVASLRAQQELETEALMLRIQRNRAEHKHHWQVNAGRMALAQRNMSSELSQRHNREAKRATEMIRAGLEPLGRVPNRKLGNTSFGVKGQARVLHVSDGTSPSRPSSVVRPTKMHGATLIKMSAMCPVVRLSHLLPCLLKSRPHLPPSYSDERRHSVNFMLVSQVILIDRAGR